MSTENEWNELIKLLDQSEKLAAQFSGGYSANFLSAEEFYAALSDSIHKFKNGDQTQLEKLYIWFLPTSCWDDFIGLDGLDLGNKISEILVNW